MFSENSFYHSHRNGPPLRKSLKSIDREAENKDIVPVQYISSDTLPGMSTLPL